jgi:hypothetical protein
MKRFANDINPPMPDTQLRAAIDAETEAFGQRICAIVRGHLDSVLAVNEAEASKLDDRDLEKARQVADTNLAKRLGRRIDGDRKKALLDDAVKKVGTGRRRPAVTDTDGFVTPASRSKGNSPSLERQPVLLSPTPCSNQFSALASVLASNMTEDEEEEQQQQQSPGTENPAKRQRRHSDPQPSGSATQSAIRPRAPARLEVHSGPKEDWSIELSKDTDVLVIGDSNLRRVDATTLPDNWEVHAFPGGKFKHVTAVISKMRRNNTLKEVVVQVGINHRNDVDVEDRTSSEIAAMERVLSGLAARVSVTGISVADTLSPWEAGTVGRINEILRDHRSFHYIEPLRVDEVGIADPEYMAIHYDGPTLAKVMSSMVAHVRSLN